MTWKSLASNLNLQVKEYQELLQILMQEQAMSIASPISKWENILAKKDICVLNLKNLELERQAILQYFFPEKNIQELKLKDILSLCSNQERSQEIVSLSNQLIETFTEIQEITNQTFAAAKGRLKAIKEFRRYFAEGTTNSNQIYSGSGLVQTQKFVNYLRHTI